MITKTLPNKILSYNNKVLDLSTPHIMGVLNVTPDSFSDGGRFNTIDTALCQCQKMIDEGASIIDIGAESTRPNAPKVTPSQELDRLTDIVSAIRQKFDDVWLSIDTSSPLVMAKMHALGADIWNDVRGLSQKGAGQLASDLDCPVVIMHSRGEPDTMNNLTDYPNGVQDIYDELKLRVDIAKSFGVRDERIIIDVGMGFAKNFDTHGQLLQNLHLFEKMGYPMLFGVSRKRFLGQILGQLPDYADHDPVMRDDIGVSAHLLAVCQGASIIRTHNVGKTMQMIKLWQAVFG